MQLPHTADALSEPPGPSLFLLWVVVDIEYCFDSIVVDRFEMFI